EGYSREEAERLLVGAYERQRAADLEKNGQVSVPQEKPDLIVIMNEAFSDLSLIGEYRTNIDYLPNIRALHEDTIKGVLYVSVFGGATSDTEYEFLTGNSMAVLPSNSVPYQQFVTEPTDSLATTLKDQGYYNIAIHPYKPTGYKRDLVYPLLGFDEFISDKDFVNPHTIRGYISDRESYSKIIEKYEAGKDRGPLFFFNVTMQNHGGYSSEQLFSDEETVRLVDYPGFGYVNQYLSLLRESDKAFGGLVDYFRQQDEPVIILLFGDHQPIAYSGLYDIMPDLEPAQQLKYKVPFVIWANYDIEEDYIEAMCANYLSSYLLELAGLKGTAYNSYLMELYNEIPVINALFYMDKEYRLYSLSEDSQYSKLIQEYKYVGYNNALDKKNRLKKYYFLQ
ncbi:MAG: LTA synthase family protein, partial [Clostridiales bacterium]|nr:LTA synthase family protein [Clostridiales bacterium]